MRFLLILFILFYPAVLRAETPVPSKKPNQNTFQNVIDKAVQAVKDELPLDDHDDDIIIPPPLPQSKIPSKQEQKIVDGIPLPSVKPFKILTLKQKTVEEPQKTGIIYYEGNHDDRTAGGGRKKASKGRERVYAEQIGRLRETDEKSPFKASKLPMAGKRSYTDPVIIFFKENSSELEVGQMDIIRSDILKPLKRSKSRTAVIYGYAMNQRGNKDATRRLSLSRALMIREYLVDNRVKPEQIEVRSMGSDTPIDPRNRVDVVLSR